MDNLDGAWSADVEELKRLIGEHLDEVEEIVSFVAKRVEKDHDDLLNAVNRLAQVAASIEHLAREVAEGHNDHETRIRTLESLAWKVIGACGVLVILGTLVDKLLHK